MSRSGPPPPGLRLATALSRLALAASALAVVALAAGFFRFADSVTAMRLPEAGLRADAAVVLTGNSNARLRAGVDLVERGLAARLLISGVNPDVTGQELRAVAGGSAELHRCCVDLGREAADTVGNAREIAAWAREHRATSLIVVTENYHMPRSLREIRRVAPDLRLVPWPVREPPYADARWWRDGRAVRGLMLEYAKYLVVRARDAARLSPPVTGTAEGPA